jgi:prepilin-type N-terminal cleavage/methylation domain-containing protein
VKARRGLTLIELIVVLTLMATVSAVVGLAAPLSRFSSTESPAAELSAARRSALSSGKPTPLWLLDSGGVPSAVAMPDGSILGDSSIAVDRFTGRMVSDSTRPR